MNIKKNDKVKIIAGKDNGKTGKVLQIFPNKMRMSVEGLNLAVKHLRPRRDGEKGQRIEFPAAFDMSNAMLVCPKCDKPTRVGHEVTVGSNGKNIKTRQCKKCKQVID